MKSIESNTQRNAIKNGGDSQVERNDTSPATNVSLHERLMLIQDFLNVVAARSTRTVLPKALNRFPINRLGFLSRFILKCYEYLFRDQREANHAIINAIQVLTQEISELLGCVKAQFDQKADRSFVEVVEARIEEILTQFDQKADRSFVEVVEVRIEEILTQVGQKADHASMDEITAQLNQKVDLAEVRSLQSQVTDHRYNILEQQRRLTLLLEEARKRLPDSMNSRQITSLIKQKDHILDAMYVSFEDRFRGTREDIKERQRFYLPYLKGPKEDPRRKPLLDLGCGRGEWLELLKENGYLALGIDINQVMIELCRERDLDVIEEDVIEFLRKQKPKTFDAITSFHLIEHLPIESLICLLDESMRVLRPQGLIILESPNPENLMVAACNFYTDPTHRNPLPPCTTSFLLEARGFVNLEILRMHPRDETCRMAENGDQVVTAFNQLFCGPQDYAVIARKA